MYVYSYNEKVNAVIKGLKFYLLEQRPLINVYITEEYSAPFPATINCP